MAKGKMPFPPKGGKAAAPFPLKGGGKKAAPFPPKKKGK